MNLSLTERIAAVLKQKIPIKNDDLKALRRACKVVWPDDDSIPKGDFRYYAIATQNGTMWFCFNEHPNSHLAIPASEFFEVGKDTNETKSIVEVALHAADLWHDEAKDRTDLKADFKSYYEGFKDGMKHGIIKTQNK